MGEGAKFYEIIFKSCLKTLTGQESPWNTEYSKPNIANTYYVSVLVSETHWRITLAQAQPQKE